MLEMYTVFLFVDIYQIEFSDFLIRLETPMKESSVFECREHLGKTVGGNRIANYSFFKSNCHYVALALHFI